MSWQKSLLNPLLRLIEKRQMANAKGPSSLRRAFEFKAKIMFHAPRGTEMEWFYLGGTTALRIGGEGLDAEKVILYCDGDRCKHTVGDGVLTEQPWAVRFEFRAVCPKPLKTIKVG